MKVLLDTNIIIHREVHRVFNPDIGHFFNWIDKLKYDKSIHPLTIMELDQDNDAQQVMNVKINSYNRLKY